MVNRQKLDNYSEVKHTSNIKKYRSAEKKSKSLPSLAKGKVKKNCKTRSKGQIKFCTLSNLTKCYPHKDNLS